MWNKLGLRFDAVPTLMDGSSWWGIALKGTVCTKRSINLCSVTTDRSMGILIRHELLHTLGMSEGAMGADVIHSNFNKMIVENWFPCLNQRISKDFTKV